AESVDEERLVDPVSSAPGQVERLLEEGDRLFEAACSQRYERRLQEHPLQVEVVLGPAPERLREPARQLLEPGQVAELESGQLERVHRERGGVRVAGVLGQLHRLLADLHRAIESKLVRVMDRE